MRFKYIGQLPIKSADLVLAGIFEPRDIIKNGTVFEIPDEEVELIQRIEITGTYEKQGGSFLNNLLNNNEEEEEEEEED